MEDYPLSDIDLQGLSEDQIQELMALGIIPDQQASLQGQIDTAQALRDRQGPQGTYTGRVYVAASPLEHLAHAMQGIKAGRQIKDLRAQQQELLAQQIRGRGTYVDALRGRKRVGSGPHSFTVGPPPMKDVDVDESLFDVGSY